MTALPVNHSAAVRHTPQGLECSFPASAENVELFIAAVHGFLSENNLGSLTFDMELLAREALVNAVQHGCGADPAKFVAATLRLEHGSLVLEVSDPGPGWDWRRGPHECEPDPASTTGRGLFIIRKYSDSFIYNDAGNALTITKRIPSQEKDMSDATERSVHMVMEQRLAAQDVPALREVFRARLQEGPTKLQLDFSRVESLDSMGIGLLVATHNSLARQGGALLLTQVRKEIYQLLTLMRLDKHFSVTQAVEDQP